MLRPSNAPFQPVQLFLPVLEDFRVAAAVRVMLLAHAPCFHDFMDWQYQLKTEFLNFRFA